MSERCDFHQFEGCTCGPGMFAQVEGRTLYPYDRTETDLDAIEREFPNALQVLDWMAPTWYREHAEARLIITSPIASTKRVLVAVAGMRSTRWVSGAQVWVLCTQGVSSYINSTKTKRRRDDHGEVRNVEFLEGRFKITNVPPRDLYPTTTMQRGTEIHRDVERAIATQRAMENL